MTATDFAAARAALLAHRTDLAAAIATCRWPVAEEFNWALDWFDAHAAGNARTALWVVEEDGSEARLSFEELARRTNQVANHFRTLGVRRGDRILMMLGNTVPLWETMLAAMKLGAVLIPATALLTPSDLVDRIDRGQVRHVVAATDAAPKFADVPGDYTRIVVGGELAGWLPYAAAYQAAHDFRPDGVTRAGDPLLLYFTSGTTARPKLVEHTHASYPVGHLTTMYWLGLLPGDVHWNISSPGWAKHAYSNVFAPWNAGCTVFVYNAARFNAQATLGALVRHGVTTLCAPPTVWRMLVQENLREYPVRLREVGSAGEPLNPEVIAQVEAAWGLTIRDGYGQTETTVQIANSPGQPVRAGSMGRAMPGYRIALLDPDGREGDEGEICLDLSAGPVGLMRGYRDDPERTADVMRDGYYHTGDVATRDADGYITYVGRADDVFKASDYRLSPFELESVLIEHPAVAEAAVVPSPDPLRLAVPKAYVVLAAGHAPDADTARAILAFARGRLAPYKRIRRIEFSDLPKTISGKIRRVELRAREQARPGDTVRQPLEFWEEDLPPGAG